MAEILNKTKPELHVFMCVNDKSSLEIKADSCGPKISKETFFTVKKWIIENNLQTNVYVTRTFCLGTCNPKGGSIVIYPEGKYYIGVQNAEEIIEIIKSKI